MNKSSANPLTKVLTRIKELKAKRAERSRINALTKELIAVVKNPDENAAKKIKNLVRQGADINTFDMDKERSLLHFAAERKRLDAVKALIENGCKTYINLNDVYGKDPAFYAIDNNNPQMLEYLLGHGVSTKRPADFNLVSSFRYAVRSGNIEMVKIELKHGADINDHVGESFRLYDKYEKTYPGPTPLAEVAAGKESYEPQSSTETTKVYDTEMLEFLLKNGARTDLCDAYGNNAYDNAKSSVVQKLLHKHKEQKRQILAEMIKQSKVKLM
ncbi:MAG: ankyrin repeat domain-containing protein [Alphaproteobacteria bacterium]|nr:ankyrin repeat domain-containing protein [Alphaproteobacteria bacterium]